MDKPGRRTDSALRQNYIVINYPVFITHWVNAYGWKTRMWAVPEGVNLDDLVVRHLTLFHTSSIHNREHKIRRHAPSSRPMPGQ